MPGLMKSILCYQSLLLLFFFTFRVCAVHCFPKFPLDIMLTEYAYSISPDTQKSLRNSAALNFGISDEFCTFLLTLQGFLGSCYKMYELFEEQQQQRL